jgi:signal transduction histidine kinase
VREQHESGGLKKDLSYFLDMMDGSVKQMRHITDDILSMQRVENMLHNEVDVVDLSQLTAMRLGNHRHQAEQERLALSLTVAPAIAVRADPVFLGEAISNFISNAIKYTPAGGQIAVRLNQTETCARLEVEDTGVGIPAKQHGKLFQPFSRVRTRETMAIEGTGLGLYLVKQIVEGYGGRTYFESEEGKGSIFGFELPLASEGVTAG